MDPKEKDIDLENKKALKKVLFYCLLYIILNYELKYLLLTSSILLFILVHIS
ncbi:MAG: hypothetical protein [Bacteriophage sp.]|nr:MAG: hypothetical protein [Bacteriophage sp.]